MLGSCGNVDISRQGWFEKGPSNGPDMCASRPECCHTRNLLLLLRNGERPLGGQGWFMKDPTAVCLECRVMDTAKGTGGRTVSVDAGKGVVDWASCYCNIVQISLAEPLHPSFVEELQFEDISLPRNIVIRKEEISTRPPSSTAPKKGLPQTIASRQPYIVPLATHAIDVLGRPLRSIVEDVINLLSSANIKSRQLENLPMLPCQIIQTISTRSSLTTCDSSMLRRVIAACCAG
jgi:hypothetical protein